MSNKVTIVPAKGNSEEFTITDQVLLLFNEHDSRIALNWELYTPRLDPKDQAMPDAGTPGS